MPQSARSSTKFNPAILVIIGAVALGLLVVAVGIGAVLAFKSRAVAPAVVGPSADTEGEEWTYKDLRDHLERKGMKYTMFSHEGNMYFIDKGDHPELDNFYIAEMTKRGLSSTPSVIVEQAPTSRDAKDRAGMHQSGTIYWGRFVIYGNDDTLKKVRIALR